VLGASGIAVAGVGGILYGWTSAEFSRLQMRCGTMCQRSDWGTQQAVEQASIVLLIVGAVALFGAAIWWIAQ
jgi:hypothetical protein